MPHFPPALLRDIADQTSIVELVGRYVQLKRKGSEILIALARAQGVVVPAEGVEAGGGRARAGAARLVARAVCLAALLAPPDRRA